MRTMELDAMTDETSSLDERGKVLLVANTAWYLFNFRRSLAETLRDSGWEVVLVASRGPYLEDLEGLGFRCIPFDFARGSKNPFRELQVVKNLYDLYRRERPAVVHHFTIKCVLYGTVAARLAGSIGIIDAVTGLGYAYTNADLRSRLIRKIIQPIYRLALNSPGVRMIFQNSRDRDVFVRSGLVPLERTTVIRGSGVDSREFRPPSEDSGSKGTATEPADAPPLKILFASRLLRNKGVFELVDAARRLCPSHPRVEFLVAGDLDPDNPASLTVKELEALRTEPNIRYLGHVDHMPDLLRRSDVVVLPTYYPEGTPRILLEAAATGLPLVATEIPGCLGVVRDGVNGFLVPVRDATALAEALERLIGDSALRKRMGRAGRRLVRERFDEEIVLRETLRVYEELEFQGERPSAPGADELPLEARSP